MTEPSRKRKLGDTIDSKHRVAVPIHFRQLLEERYGSPEVWMSQSPNSSVVFLPAHWGDLVYQRTKAWLRSGSQSLYFFRSILKNEECRAIPDMNGRLMIPKALRRFAGLDVQGFEQIPEELQVSAGLNAEDFDRKVAWKSREACWYELWGAQRYRSWEWDLGLGAAGAHGTTADKAWPWGQAQMKLEEIIYAIHEAELESVEEEP